MANLQGLDRPKCRCAAAGGDGARSHDLGLPGGVGAAVLAAGADPLHGLGEVLDPVHDPGLHLVAVRRVVQSADGLHRHDLVRPGRLSRHRRLHRGPAAEEHRRLVVLPRPGGGAGGRRARGAGHRLFLRSPHAHLFRHPDAGLRPHRLPDRLQVVRLHRRRQRPDRHTGAWLDRRADLRELLQVRARHLRRRDLPPVAHRQLAVRQGAHRHPREPRARRLHRHPGRSLSPLCLRPGRRLLRPGRRPDHGQRPQRLSRPGALDPVDPGAADEPAGRRLHLLRPDRRRPAAADDGCRHHPELPGDLAALPGRRAGADPVRPAGRHRRLHPGTRRRQRRRPRHPDSPSCCASSGASPGCSSGGALVFTTSSASCTRPARGCCRGRGNFVPCSLATWGIVPCALLQLVVGGVGAVAAAAARRPVQSDRRRAAARPAGRRPGAARLPRHAALGAADRAAVGRSSPSTRSARRTSGAPIGIGRPAAGGG